MNTIINPINGEKYDLYSTKGRTLLKEYIQNYKIGGMDDIDLLGSFKTTEPPEYKFPFSIWDPDVGFIEINNYGDIIKLIETNDKLPIYRYNLEDLSEQNQKYSNMIDNFKRNTSSSTSPRRSERLKLKRIKRT